MRRPIFLAATVVLALTATSRGAEPLDTFLKIVPSDANAVMVLRVGDLLKSPRAQREDWAGKSREEFLAGSVQIPTWVTAVYRASRLRPEEGQTLWSTGVIGVPEALDFEKLAEREYGIAETIAGSRFVRTRRGGCLTPLSPTVLGLFAPGYRQDFARWLAFARGNTKSQMSAYLASAVTRSDAPVLLALDLQEMFAPDHVEAWLRHSPTGRNMTKNFEPFAHRISWLQGLRLEATVREDTQARLFLDFASDVTDFPNEIKAVLLEFLEQSGAAIDEFEKASIQASGSSVVLSTGLSDDSLRRLLSVITAPNPLSQSASPAEKPAPRPAASDVGASRRYYTAVNKLVDDLTQRHARAKNYTKTAVWHENFAKKIDEQPIEGVHLELAKYGAEASLRMKALAASLRGAPLEVRTIGNTLTYNVRVDPGFGAVNVWGGVGYRPPTWEVDSNLQAVRDRQAEAVQRSADERELIWAEIEKDRRAIRLRMKEVFNEDFDVRQRP